MISVTCIFIASITLYIVVLFRVNYKFLCRVMVYMVYGDTTSHNWAQAVGSFELNYDFMHMYYWKFNLFF